MDKQFSASEVRDRERFEEWYTTHAFNYSRDPIGSRDCSLQWESWKAARIDLLEAQEKAVPVAWANPDDLANPVFVGINVAKATHPDLGRHYTQPLYTHSAQAQPCSGQSCPHCEPEHGCNRSAQAQPPAQPPAARVPAEMPWDDEENNAGKGFISGWNACRDAILAAQENPNG